MIINQDITTTTTTTSLNNRGRVFLSWFLPVILIGGTGVVVAFAFVHSRTTEQRRGGYIIEEKQSIEMGQPMQQQQQQQPQVIYQ